MRRRMSHPLAGSTRKCKHMMARRRYTVQQPRSGAPTSTPTSPARHCLHATRLSRARYSYRRQASRTRRSEGAMLSNIACGEGSGCSFSCGRSSLSAGSCHCGSCTFSAGSCQCRACGRCAAVRLPKALAPGSAGGASPRCALRVDAPPAVRDADALVRACMSADASATRSSSSKLSGLASGSFLALLPLFAALRSSASFRLQATCDTSTCAIQHAAAIARMERSWHASWHA
jgi:hypothetical protein